MSRIKRPLLERILEAIDTTGGHNACHEWTKARNEHGYGVVAIGNGRTRLAHRKLWELTNDVELTRQQKVCHSCDNPPCCNLIHLFVGTQADNIADMAAKGRASYIGLLDRNNQGTNHGMSKMDDDMVREIRRLYATKTTTQRALAKRFGISQGTASEIIRGVLWPHVR
jgi:hypothetical protein